MNRLIGYQKDFEGNETEVWSSGKPPQPTKQERDAERERLCMDAAVAATASVLAVLGFRGPRSKSSLAAATGLPLRVVSSVLKHSGEAGKVRKTMFTERNASGKFESTWELS